MTEKEQDEFLTLLKSQFKNSLDVLNYKFKQTEIASRTGYGKSYVSKLAKGEIPPSKDFLRIYLEKFPEIDKATFDETILETFQLNGDTKEIVHRTNGLTDRNSIDRILSVLERQVTIIESQQHTIQTLADKISPIAAGAVAG